MATQQISSPAPLERCLLSAELTDIAERSLNFTRAAGAVVLLVREDQLVVAGKAGGVMEHCQRIPVEGSFAGRVVQTGSVSRCDSVDSDSGVDVTPFLPLRVRSLVAVPIAVGTRHVAGVLVVVSESPAGFLRTHFAILKTLADVAAEKCRHEPALLDTAMPEMNTASIPAPRKAPQTDDRPTLAVHSSAASEPHKPHEEILSLAEAAKPLPPLSSSGEGLGAASRTYSTVRPRVASAYDRPHTVYHPQQQQRIPTTLAVVVVLFLAALGGLWRYSHRAQNTVANGAAVAAPSPAAPVALPVAQPAPAQPAPASVVPAVESVTHGSATATKPERAPIQQAASELPEEEAPIQIAPPLRQPSLVARGLVSNLEAPKLALSSSKAPELLPAPAALPVTVSRLVPARLVERVAPQFPPLLRNAKREGSVSLRLHISPLGDVDHVEMTGGDSAFLKAAEEAVKQWRYTPASLNGKAIASSAEVLLEFKLPRH